MRTPHTGGKQYDSAVAKIPHAPVTAEDASMVHRMQARSESIVVRLETGAQTPPDAPSRNVVADLRGRELPDEVVVVSGHLDSWDVGRGAMDDAGGVIPAWEAVRPMHMLGMRPRRLPHTAPPASSR
jgi:carboxypeptidase Q